MKRHRKIIMVKMVNGLNWLWLLALAGLFYAEQVAAFASCENQDPAETHAEGPQAADARGAETQDPEMQDAPDITTLKPSVLTEPPPRNLTVKEQTEPWSGQTYPPTPLLREKKYVAALQIVPPRLSIEQQEIAARLLQTLGNRPIVPVESRSLPFPAYSINFHGDLTVFYTGFPVFGKRSRTFENVSRNTVISPQIDRIDVVLGRLFAPVVQTIPESQRPSTASLDFILRNPNEGLIAGDQFEKFQQGNGLPRMLFYVASPAEAQEIGNAWMTLVDYAITYPGQRELWARWRAEWDRGADLQERLAAATRRLAENTAALAGREPVPAAVIESIAQRRYNVEIDLQGVRARHEAIRAAMEDRINGGLVTRLLELQVEAQVELHGLESQLRLMEKMIAEYREIRELQERISTDYGSRHELQTAVGQYPWELEALRLASEVLQPLEVEGNEIQLYPITWPE